MWWLFNLIYTIFDSSIRAAYVIYCNCISKNVLFEKNISCMIDLTDIIIIILHIHTHTHLYMLQNMQILDEIIAEK